LNKLQAIKAGYYTFGRNPLTAIVMKRDASGAVHLVIFAADKNREVKEVTNYVAVGTDNSDRLYEKDGRFLLKVNPGYNPTDWANEVWQEALSELDIRTVDLEFVIRGRLSHRVDVVNEVSDEKLLSLLKEGRCTFGTFVGEQLWAVEDADYVGLVTHSTIDDEEASEFTLEPVEVL
jgi:hypothetical protein